MKYLYSFVVLFLPWLVLSGKFDPVHVGMGVLCSSLVAYWCADLLFQNKATTLGERLRQLIGFVGYIGWLLGEIIRANLHVFRVALSPRMNELVEPQMVEFETKLGHTFSKVTKCLSVCTLWPYSIVV